jgi:hypothetical protein
MSDRIMKRNWKKGYEKNYSIIFLFFLYFSLNVGAQCAMCRAALGGKGSNVQAQAVNDGIVYLMAIPYILVAGIGYGVYRIRKNKSGLKQFVLF